MAEFAVWQQNVAYPARYDRALVAELFGEGVIDVAGGSLRVTERAAGANMSVTPRQGRCVVDGDEQADQEAYLCVFDDAVNLSVASADPDNPRKDRVIVRVQDSAVSGATDGPIREVLTGTPAVSPTAPAVPDSAISLAIVDVAAGASSITDADITDDRIEVAGGLFVARAGDTMGDALTIAKDAGGALLVVKNSGASGDVRAQVDNRDAGGFGLEILAGATGTQIRDLDNTANRVLIDGSAFNFQTAVQINGNPVPVRDASTYLGDGTSGQTVSLPFTPVQVTIQSEIDDTTSGADGGYTLETAGGILFKDSGTSRASFPQIASGGFRVGQTDLNEDGVTYHYVAIG